MPMHDWTRVDAGIYHDFHHEWISETKRALNRGLLPPDYYALAEQVAAGFGPDVLTLQDQTIAPASNGGGIATQTRPKTTYYTELPGEFKQRRKSLVAVRHVSGDHIVAMIELRAYIETIAVGDALPDMPLFLAPDFYVTVPLEATYQAAWDTVPARWQRVIASVQ
jgi:hypothetical protein